MRIAYCVVVLITAAPAALPDTTNVKPIHVPYRLTKTQHILVRAKINGKGSYNFIVDTGAPALFVSKKTADAAGVNPDKPAGPPLIGSRSRGEWCCRGKQAKSTICSSSRV